MRRWGDLTWTEVREAIASKKLIAVLPVGATEAHGPHLALDTDVVIAEEVAHRAEAGLTALGLIPLLLPPVAYAVTRFAVAFPGTIGVGPTAARALLADIASALAQQHVTLLLLVNHHLEPAHVEILRDLTARPPAGLRVIFPDHTRRALAGTLGAEFATGDCHAGSYETSIVLAAREGAGRVREGVRTALAPRWLGLIEAIKGGKRTFGDLGATEAYVGDPAAASAAEGEKLLARLAEILVERVKTELAELGRR
jgi:creatinine amidohydrolase